MLGQSFLMGNRLRRLTLIVWRAARLWMRHDCVDLSAAFAYHSLQSVLPALLIALSVAARVLGRQEGLVDALLSSASHWLPPASLLAFESVVERFLRQGFGAGLFGFLLLMLTASNAYLTLQRGADRLWWQRPFDLPNLSWRRLVLRYVRLRLKAVALVGLIGLFIAADQLITSRRLLGSLDLLDAVLQLMPQALPWQRPVTLGLDVLVSLLLTFAGALLFLWLLPSRRIPWRPLVPGATLASLALTLLNLMLGRALFALGLRFQAYGVVGGILLLTLWVWLVGVILYYAQCFAITLAPRNLPRQDGFIAGV